MVISTCNVTFPDICSSLVDKKVALVDKVTSLKQLSAEESGYDQIVVDWICATVEYVSNTEKYIELNGKEINELLQILNFRLRVKLQSVKKLLLQPNLFDVLTRFSSSSSVISCAILLQTWHTLLQHDQWKDNLNSKSTAAALSWLCELSMSEGCEVDKNMSMEVIEMLLQCYLAYVRSLYVSKKVFMLFCKQLLIKLMCLYSVCSQRPCKSNENILTSVTQIFALVLCSKEQLGSLKLVLKSPSDNTEATPPKKMKLDDSVEQNENGAPTYRKHNDSKDNLHFRHLFNEFREAHTSVNGHLLKSLPKFYEALVTSSRLSSQSSLSRMEETRLLVRLKECFNFDFTATAMTSLTQLLDVVIQHDIYQRSGDITAGNTFQKWMADLMEKIINHQEREDRGNAELELCSLQVMLKMLTINHSVLAPWLTKIWNICLRRRKADCRELAEMKESLLNHLFDTYDKLHQLDQLLETFEPVMMKEGEEICVVYSPQFIERYERSLASLLTVQINGILDIYATKLKDASGKLLSDSTGLSVEGVLHQTYLLCYLVLMNASVVPANGYRKAELTVYLEKLKRIKNLVNDLVQQQQQQQKKNSEMSSWTLVDVASLPPPGYMGSYPVARNIENCELVMVSLVQHGINNTVSVLRQFDLLEEEDQELTVFDDYSQQLCKGRSCVEEYLTVALCFDSLGGSDQCGGDGGGGDDSQSDLIKRAKEIYNDACNEDLSEEEAWNGQILCITERTLQSSLVKLFEENLSTIVSVEDQDLFPCCFQLLWKRLLRIANTSGVNSAPSTSEYHVLQSVHCYNNARFQSCLLYSAQDCIVTHMKGVSSVTALIGTLCGEGGREKMIEIRDTWDSFSDADVSGECDEEEEVDEEGLQRVFMLLDKLPLDYLTETNLFTFSVMVLNVWELTRNSSHVSISNCCVHTVGRIMAVYSSDSRSLCHLPLSYIFNTNLSYLHRANKVGCSGVVVSLCVDTIKTVVRYISKDQPVVASICSKLVSSLSDEPAGDAVVEIAEKTLRLFVKILHKPTRKSRSKQTAYQIVSALSPSLLKMMTSTINTPPPPPLFAIYGSLCQIVQHAQLTRGGCSPLTSVEEEIVGSFPVVVNSINKLLLSSTPTHHQHLQVLKFLYSSSQDLTSQLRQLLGHEEDKLVEMLLDNVAEPYVDEYGTLVATIVLEAGEDMLKKLLNLLAEKLVLLVKEYDSSWLLKIWTIVLSAKWEKEQRIVLWEFLPKVMVAGVHLIKSTATTDDVILLLNLLTSAVNIGKNSLMSQYVNIIYHTFVMLPATLKQTNYHRFVETFEAMYQLCSQLLFHHQSAILASFHAYITSVDSLLEMLCSYSSCIGQQTEDSLKCCERMARLYREIGGHKGIVTKYAPYIVCGFIRIVLSSSLSTAEKRVVESGIYCIMDTCSDSEMSFLNTSLEKGDKQYFTMLNNNYEKHHKFTGKA